MTNNLFLLGVMLTTFTYYALLVFSVNVIRVPTDMLAIMVRSVGLLALIGAVLLRGLPRSLENRFFYLFLVVSFFYVTRLSFSFRDSGHSSPWFLIASYVAYVFMPFILILSVRVTRNAYDTLLAWTLLSLAGFGFLCAIFYYDQLGGGRLLSRDDGAILNPLILSYVSSAGIGIAYYLMLMRRGSLTYLSAIIVLLMIPFLLGASRGSVLSLIAAAIFAAVARSEQPTRTSNIVVSFLVMVGVVIFFGDAFSAITSRVMSIFSDIESGSSSSSRLDIWRLSFEQFAANPLAGSSHIVKGYGYYPHNMFLEMLISTGLFGFLALFAFVFYLVKECYWLIRHFPEYGWLSILAIQQLVRYSFSHSFYTAVFFFVFAALVISIVNLLKQPEDIVTDESMGSGPVQKMIF